jgi:hypothetical protein
VNNTGATVRLNGFASPPGGNYNFKYRRIYRSLVGGTFQFVAEIPIATTQYDDSKTAAQLAGELASTFYTPPPSGLRGLVAMPNGILAGFVGNQIWFCEPYLPHAWPSGYMLTVDSPVVGLGVFGNSLFVGTTRHPYVITGSSPQTMTQEKLPLLQPCVSKRSIASDQYGVMFASPNGIVSIGSGVQDVLTESIYTRDEWALTFPSTMSGVLYNNRYIGLYAEGSPPQSRALVLQRGSRPSLTTLSLQASCAFVDPTGALYARKDADNKIYALDYRIPGFPNPTYTTYLWRSKKFLLNKAASMSALKVFGAFEERLTNPTLYVEVLMYCDGELHQIVRVESDGVYRIVGGVRGTTWQFELRGNLAVRQFIVATSVEELKAVGTP